MSACSVTKSDIQTIHIHFRFEASLSGLKEGMFQNKNETRIAIYAVGIRDGLCDIWLRIIMIQVCTKTAVRKRNAEQVRDGSQALDFEFGVGLRKGEEENHRACAERKHVQRHVILDLDK